MRLAVVSPFVDRRHGTERAVAELLERLASDYQCEIHLYAQRVEDLRLSQAAKFPANVAGIFWHRVPAVRGPQPVQFLFWFYANRLSRFADRLFRHASFDLVLSPGINCSDAQVIFVHALFHRLRELLQEETGRDSKGFGFFRGLHRRAYYALLTHFEKRIYSNRGVALAAVSSRTAESLARYFHREDVVVIPNGVDGSQFSPEARLARRADARDRRRIRQDEFVLLLIGNDWVNKGLPAILEALAKLSDIPAKLLILGNDCPALYQEMAERLNVLGQCLWERAAGNILEVYAAADLYVSPSREDSFGMPVAESMACGLPVITSAFAGVASLLHDGIDGFILQDPLDSRSLAVLIRKLFEEPGFRDHVGQAAARAARNWTWDRNAACIWELLKKAAARG